MKIQHTIIVLGVLLAACHDSSVALVKTQIQVPSPLNVVKGTASFEFTIADVQIDSGTLVAGRIDASGTYTFDDDLRGDPVTATLLIESGTYELLRASTTVELDADMTITFSPEDFTQPDEDGDGVTNWVAFNRGCEVAGGGCEWLDVSVGGLHTCAIGNDLELYCWGDNSQHQLGVNLAAGAQETGTPTLVPRIDSSRRYSQVSAGLFHTCAIDSEGNLYCWGQNIHGQVGDSTTDDALLPKNVGVDVGRWTMVDASARHTCAISTDSTLYCWGDDTDSRLGLEAGTGTTMDEPSTVDAGDSESLGGWTYVNSGPENICGLKGDQLYCWGTNALGFVDAGQTGSAVTTPHSMANGVTLVAVGAQHICTTNANEQTDCFGDDGRHQTLENVTQDVGFISAGDDHTCGLNSARQPECWGHDHHGRLGTAPNNGGTNYRFVLTGISNAVQVSSGLSHTCVRADGGLHCWGSNSHGQLGNGTTGLKRAPAQLALGSGFFGITAGDRHTCAWNATDIYCWGANELGQLGNGTNAPRQAGSQIAGSGFGTPTSVGAGANHVCALDSNDDIRCWGDSSLAQIGANVDPDDPPNQIYLAPFTLPTPPNLQFPATGTWRTLTVGSHHSCAAAADGGVDTIHCWGSNEFGQAGETAFAAVWRPMVAFNTWTGVFSQVAAGTDHTCTYIDGIPVSCFGQLGGITAADDLADFGAASGTWAGASGGDGFHCTLHDAVINNNVRCWGKNDSGQLASGSTADNNTPWEIDSMSYSDFIAVDAGPRHACAISDANGLFCWGDNYYGQIGHDLPNPNETLATLVDSSSNWEAVAAGDTHTCAIRAGLPYCWGNNYDGQLGIDDAWQDVPTTVPLPF